MSEDIEDEDEQAAPEVCCYPDCGSLYVTDSCAACGRPLCDSHGEADACGHLWCGWC